MLLVSLFEQPERLVFVAESRINLRNCIEIDISVRGQVPEFLGDLQRIIPPARDGVNPTKAVSNRSCRQRAYVLAADKDRFLTMGRE